MEKITKEQADQLEEAVCEFAKATGSKVINVPPGSSAFQRMLRRQNSLIQQGKATSDSAMDILAEELARDKQLH